MRLEALDRRLARDDPRPLVVALSGGGDSVALLLLAAPWARSAGRRILALTVDHGLNPESARWTAAARALAERTGVSWRGLDWTGSKPQAGLPAAARRARHALIADAARQAGASVILMGHTADDQAENAWMNRHGSSIGRLRAWAPSPVWPEGRGLMLLRPLLNIRRAALRTWLSARDIGWIDDPANDDPRFARARARAALAGAPAEPPGDAQPPPDLRGDGAGLIQGPLSSPWLAQALLCASGRETPPGREAVDRLRDRLSTGGTATLAGARVLARDGQVRIGREAGRDGLRELALEPGQEAVWDGRHAVLTDRGGWRIGAAAGRRARLCAKDRAALTLWPPPFRSVQPVLFRADGPCPVLASPDVNVRCLVAERLRLATGGAAREADLVASAMA